MKSKFPKAVKSPKVSKRPTVSARKRQYILLLGDEGAMLVHMQGRKVLERLHAPSSDIQNTRRMQEMFAKDPKTPVSILVDMIDQSYVRHTMPPVSSLSIGKLIQRRLDRDFSAEDIKGAVPLGRDGGGRKDWNYLLISLSYTPQFAQWMEMLQTVTNPVGGIYLVPVESQHFLARLQPSLPVQGDTKPKWQLLVSHNRVGGFRQVVFKEGKLVFTRLAQPLGDMLPEVIAGNIEQEVQSTVEYLKRLSYQEQDGLETVVIAAEDVTRAIDVKNLRCKTAHLLTPFEVAEKIGLEDAAIPTDRYGDIVLAAAIGLDKKHVLRMQAPGTGSISTLYSVQKVVRFGGAAAAAGLVCYALFQFGSIFPLLGEIDEMEIKDRQEAKKIAEAQQQGKDLPDSVDRINDVVETYDMLAAGEYSPFDILGLFASALEDGILVRQIDWGATDGFSAAEGAKTEGGDAAAAVNVNFQVEFRKNTDKPELFREFVSAFSKRLEGAFPDYQITIGALPPGYLPEEVVQFDLGANADDLAAKQAALLRDMVDLPVNIKGPIAKGSKKLESEKPASKASGTFRKMGL